MVLVQGVQVKAKLISRGRIAKVWKTLTNKPLPKIRALQLSDEDFNRMIDYRRCPADQLREIEEWGRTLSTNGTDACVFNAGHTDNAEFIILIRENPYHNINEIIVHELSHIEKGDL